MGGRWALEQKRMWNESFFEVLPALAPVDIGKPEHPVAVDGKPVWSFPSSDKDRPSG